MNSDSNINDDVAPFTKEQVLAAPDQYPWNCVLAYLQFTPEELLSVRDHLDLRALIRYQTCVSRDWLREHFANDIEQSPHVSWGLVDFLVAESQSTNE